MTRLTAFFSRIWDEGNTLICEVAHERQLFFATFDPLYINAPATCPLCFVQPPAFNYEYCVEQKDGKRNYVKGYCSTTCSGTLLHRLAGREAKEWAEEEEELAAGQLDVTDLQKRRLATFGNLVR